VWLDEVGEEEYRAAVAAAGKGDPIR
jgi:hypothetical protein